MTPRLRQLWLLCALALSAPILAADPAQTQNPKSKIQSQTISFLNDVEPILTRAGCNQGACHGSQFGKGGFKLSLAAYDPDFDYQSIVKVSGGRRLNLTEPERSLLLLKPTLRMAHKGGLALQAGSADYRTVLAWLRQGAPGPDPGDPTVVALTVTPDSRVLSPGHEIRLRAVASYSNGTRREVTAHTRISSLDDTIARSTPEGLVTAVGRGATAIMLRYAGQAAVTRITVPYREARAAQSRTQSPGSRVDELVAAKWRDLGLDPSPLADDYTFLRRASLDVIGTLPTAGEVRDFAADRDPAKRAKLIERLLDRPEYADYWTVKWCDLLRSSRSALGAKPAAALTEWVRSAFARNMPFDRFVREILTAQGSASGVAPANYFRVAVTPEELTETTSQLFLGVRLQCARCHHHPFEKWSQSDYYRFAALFARVGATPSAPEPFITQRSAGEVKHPKTGASMDPAPLRMEGSPAFRLGVADRREALADWLTDRRNLAFARTVVNRYWAYFLGRGIVDPVDDIRVTNPPTNPDLLDHLAERFINSGYDVKALIRAICGSRVYQLSSEPNGTNRADKVFYSHFLRKRQPAEVMLDSLAAATGIPEKFEGLPAGTRAIQLPDPGIASAFLDTFGRPPRSSACECDRVTAPSLPQALLLLNGGSINSRIGAPTGRAANLAAASLNDAQVVEELFLSALSRPPAAAELRSALAAFRTQTRRQAAEDLLWALLNTNEFAYIR